VPRGPPAASAQIRRPRAPEIPTWPYASPPSASPTSAKPPACGTGPPGQAHPPRHRLAGPPHRLRLRRASGGGHEPHFRDRTGLVLDPYFSGTKIAWLLDTRARRPRRADRGRARVRHHRHLARLAPHRRRGARHRRHQRLAHPAVERHPTGDWDDELLPSSNVPRAAAPEVRRLQRDLRHHHALLPRPARRHPHRRHRRRPAGRPLRPGLLPARRSPSAPTAPALPPDEHRRPAPPKQQRLLTTVGGGSASTTTYALEGSVFIAGAAVQWLRDGLGIIKRRRDRARSPRACRTAAASTSCPPSPASAPPTGAPRPRVIHRRHHAGHHRRPPRPRHARGHRLPSRHPPRHASRPQKASDDPARRRRRLSQRPPHAIPGRPPRRPSSAPPSSRPPPSAPPSSPASPSASGRPGRAPAPIHSPAAPPYTSHTSPDPLSSTQHANAGPYCTEPSATGSIARTGCGPSPSRSTALTARGSPTRLKLRCTASVKRSSLTSTHSVSFPIAPVHARRYRTPDPAGHQHPRQI
jgi:hypothetical protein